MNFTILCVGSIKEKYLQEGISDYRKRLSKYGKIEIIEVPECKVLEKSIEQEGLALLKRLPKDAYVFVLDLKGKEYSSPEFGEQIQEIFTYHNSQIVFIIGGSLGLSREVKDASNGKIAFSKMTFPHQLMRLILLEQIYRGVKILKNETYHK